jgi:hypothetical protein
MTLYRHFAPRIHAAHLAAMLAAALLSACGGSPGPIDIPVRLDGPTSFVSADHVDMMTDPVTLPLDDTFVVPAAGSPSQIVTPASAVARSTVAGDIYRVLDSGKTILYLNAYRGLQIIDIGDSANPRIAGQLAIGGTPVEMIRDGNFAYILVNNWTQYRRFSKDGMQGLAHGTGAAVLTVDLSNRAAPRIVSTAPIDGMVVASRLSSGGAKRALYVATGDGPPLVTFASASPASAAVTTMAPNTPPKSMVYGFSINAQGTLARKSTIALDGMVSAVDASAQRLLVARSPSWFEQVSTISVIDISSPDGLMLQGADVPLLGRVERKENFQVQGNILRVVSADTGFVAMSHLQTFNIADLAHPKAVARADFGLGQQLFGTVFLSDKAFFVTYLRTDPFHAFSISADGEVTQENTFSVSGWNDFFVPVQGQSRLIGIGHNDDNARSVLAVSLYDISTLKNSRPLLMREDIDLAQAWSNGTWDERAFTVLENAASATAPDGMTQETGLVLLPFTGQNITSGEQESGVQLFTFSASTLTRRAALRHPSPVARSFVSDTAKRNAVNLSSSDLSLFDIGDADHALAKGKLALARSTSQFLAFGKVGVRYQQSDVFAARNAAARTDTLELVALADAANGTPLASIAIPPNSTIYNVDEKLIVISRQDGYAIADGPTDTIVASYDINDPAHPRKLGQLITTALGRPDFYVAAATGCGSPLRCGLTFSNVGTKVVGSTIVFATPVDAPPPQALAPRTPSRPSYALQVLDLSNPAQPSLQAKMPMPGDEELAATVQVGSTLWLNFKKAQAPSADGLAQARYFMKALDLSHPAKPLMGKEINIPGRLRAVDGKFIYTIDSTWTAGAVQASVDVLALQDGLAYLQDSYRYDDLHVTDLLVDGANMVVVSADRDNQATMQVYAVANGVRGVASTLRLDGMQSVKGLSHGKAVLTATGGFVSYDISDPKAVFPRAFFPANGYASELVFQNNAAYLPANTYGLYQFNLDAANLTAP